MKKKGDGAGLYAADIGKKLELPVGDRVTAGFPSPAADYIDSKLDLNEYLIKNPVATFFVKVVGDSMIDAGINSGDLIIVDRSLEPRSNSIILAELDGEFTVKRFVRRGKRAFLVPENKNYSEIEITENTNFEAWGVATSVIHQLS